MAFSFFVFEGKDLILDDSYGLLEGSRVGVTRDWDWRFPLGFARNFSLHTVFTPATLDTYLVHCIDRIVSWIFRYYMQ
jgi:hypothetical protein